MKYATCLRCHRKLTSEHSQKLGYGPVCYKKHLEESESVNLSIEDAHYHDYFNYGFGIRQEGLKNCAKLFSRTHVQPKHTIDEQSSGSNGTYFHGPDKITVRTKMSISYRHFNRIEVFGHELIHATGNYSRLCRGWQREIIRGEPVDVLEEMVAELGSYLLLKMCHVFQDSNTENEFLSKQLWRIRELHLRYLSEDKRFYYISRLKEMYLRAEYAVNYLFKGL